MKILYLITGLRLGGAEKQLLLLAGQMQLRGFQVLVVAMESGGAMSDDFFSSGINVEELNVTGMGSLPAAFNKFRRLVKQFSPEIIHSHMIHANIFASLLKMGNLNYKLICTAHNIREGGKFMMSFYYLVRTAANWSTNVSNEAYDFFIRKKYFNPERSSFIPNAINTASFDPVKFNKSITRIQYNIPDHSYVFLAAGRLHYQKNYPMLIKSFALVKKCVPSALLIIAGEGEDLQELRTLSIKLSIEEDTQFLGRQNNMPALMNMSDCFVLSSRFEGFGLVIAESMSMQLPVISTDCGGVKEVMGGNGMLVAVGDIKGLAHAMIDITNTPGNYNNSTSRQHIIDNYGLAVVLKKWMNLYKRLC